MRISLALCLALSLSLWAEEAPMEVNPNRTTFSTPASTTKPGQLELEWGGQLVQTRDDSNNFGTPTLLKLGVMKDLELRLASPGYLRLAASGTDTVSGFGDLSLGVQWCYRHDGIFGADQAIQVTHTFPTANADKGLGNGAPSDLLMLIFSKDIGIHHVDFNLLETWIGRQAQDGGGRISQPAISSSISHPFSDAWSLTGELYAIGRTEVNPRIVSNLWAVAYKVSPGLVLDAGVDLGLTNGAQRVSWFAGLTVGLARFRPLR